MATYTVTTIFDEAFDGYETSASPDNAGLSLREAIGLAAASAGADTIEFDSSLLGRTLELTGGTLTIDDTDGVTISGDVTIDAQSRFRVASVTGGSATFDGLIITGGAATSGAGLSVESGASLTLTDTTVAGNTATSDGGGAYVAGTLVAVNTTFDGNDATTGGAVSVAASADATFANATFYGNSATAGDGGAIANAGTLTLSSSTLTGNAASGDGGAVADTSSTLTITNTIMAGNASGGAGTEDLSGAIDTASGVNLFGQASVSGAGVSDTTGAAAASIFDSTASVNGATAGVLADNGGSVETVLILSGGLAEDAGDDSALPLDVADIDGDGDDTEALPLDATGGTRVEGGALDIGAVERARAFEVTTDDDELDDIDGLGTVSLANFGGASDLSLREAIALVNLYGENANTTLTFDSTLSGATISLASLGAITIENAVSIEGLGEGSLTIDGGSAAQLFTVDAASSSTVSLSDLTLSNGYATNGGAIRVYSGALTATDVTFSGNTAEQGGAIWHDGDGLTLESTTFNNNVATSSSAAGGAIGAGGTVNITNSAFTGNAAYGVDQAHGGAIRLISGAVATVSGSTFESNNVNTDYDIGVLIPAYGGAISAYAATLSIDNTTFDANTAYASAYALGRVYGGALAVEGGELIVTSSIIANGSATGSGSYALGGGLAIVDDAVATIIDTEILGNSLSSTALIGGLMYGAGIGIRDATATIVNSTIAFNATTGPFAYEGEGGGLYVGYASRASFNVINTTFYANYAGTGGGIFSSSPGSITNSTLTGNAAQYGSGISWSSAVTLANTVVAGNSQNTDEIDGATSAGGNVVDSSSVSSFTLDSSDVDEDTPSNIFKTVNTITVGGYSVDAGELADNGGPVRTVALASDSVALDVGLAANLPADTEDLDDDSDTAEDLPVDARGETRSVGDAVDAGAYELQLVGTLTVTTLDDESYDGGTYEDELADGGGLSLREAIGLVNDGHESDDTVVEFLSSLSGTLTLASTIDIEHSVSIEGLGEGSLTIDGGGTVQLFTIDGASTTEVSLSDLTLSNGYASRGGAIRVSSGALTATDVTFSDNTAEQGGAIYHVGDGLTLESATFSGNLAYDSPRAAGGAIYANGTVDITESTFSGNTAYSDIQASGGALYLGGLAAATISGSTFDSNTADARGGSSNVLATGGAIVASSATLSIDDTTFDANSLYAAENLYGGALYMSGGTLTLTSSIIENGSLTITDGHYGSAGGGGIHLHSADATIIDTEIRGNSLVAQSDIEPLTGGGIALRGATATILNSTIADNAIEAPVGSRGAGGGLYVNYLSTADVINSTFYGNYAGRGGAISARSTLSLINSTVTGNTGDSGSAIYSADASDVTVANSIVAGNSQNTSEIFNATSAGGNVVNSNSVSNFTLDSSDVDENTPSSIFETVNTMTVGGYSVDAGALADNGGAVRTVALASDSVALDVGLVANLPADTEDLDDDADTAEDLPVDARGADRSIDVTDSGDLPDAGAFELETSTLVVTTADDETYDGGTLADETADGGGLSLREALAIANSLVASATITFDAGLAGSTIDISTEGTLVLTNDITINGDTGSDGDQDITVSGGDAVTVFEVDDGDTDNAVTGAFEGLVIQNGYTLGGGGGIYAGYGDNVTLTNVTVSGNEAYGYGGGILVDGGALTLTSSTISDNVSGGDAGGIFTFAATVNIADSTISGNRAGYYGGGLALINSTSDTITNTVITGNAAYTSGPYAEGYGEGGGAFILGSGAVTIFESTISENEAGYSGGGLQLLYNSGTVQISETTIDSNSAFDGGGLWIAYSDVAVENSTISRNFVENDGGAIYTQQNNELTLTLTNTTIAMNVALDDGGGVHLDGLSGAGPLDNTLVLLNSTVTSNYAGEYGGGLYINGATASTAIMNSIVSGNGINPAYSGTDIYAAALPTTFASYSVIGTDLIDGSGGSTALGASQDAVSAILFDDTSDFVDINGDTVQLGTREPSLGVLGGVLADNGGNVETVALRTGGVGIDAGDDSAASGLSTDGRGGGFTRIVGDAVDVGAYEAQTVAPVFEGDLADFAQTVTLDENSADGTAVVDVDANDGSGGATDSGVTYAIIAGNTSGDGDSDLPFAIDSLTGAITVNDAGDLDFETTPAFTLTVEADNGSATNTATVTVELNDLNEAPVFAGLDATPSFTEGGSAVTLDADATISDEDLDALNSGIGNYSGAALTLERSGGADTDDVFGFSFGPASDVSLVGSAFRVGGTTIATLSQSGGTATVTFTDANGETPTSAHADAILQAATYENSATSLHTGDSEVATIAYTFDDGSGLSNATVTGTVDVTVNGADNGVNLTGTSSDDRLTGTDDDDTISGLGGNDTIEGGEGADDLDGGDGINDALYYRNSSAAVTIDLGAGTASGGEAEGDQIANFERVLGSEFGDDLTGSSGTDRLFGYSGDDTIDGAGGNDWLSGGDGEDEILGGSGNDIVDGGDGADDLDGGDGVNDTLRYRSSSAAVTVDLGASTASGGDAEGDQIANFERVLGSEYGDDLTGSSATDRLLGYGGDDTIDGAGGSDRLTGGDGDDEIVGGSGNDTVDGGEGADDLDGGDGINDALYYRNSSAAVTVDLGAGIASGGEAEGDQIANFERVLGSEYGDDLTGSSGTDRLFGYSGDDTIDGAGGNDRLTGGDGEDAIVGGSGNDIVDGGDGADDLDGGDGINDALRYRNSTAAVTIDLGAGTASGGEAEGDQIANFERVLGSEFGDDLTGSSGIDRLFGYNGDDTIDGADGDDRLDGGEGQDSLTGGSGADRFTFDSGDSTSAAPDIITDFSGASGDADRIDLSAFATSFEAGGAFTGTAGEVIFSKGSGTTTVSVDTDGDAAADFVLTLSGALDLVENDFIL